MNKPRTSGRKVAFGLLALIAAIVATAITFWWNTREPHGPILGMAAVDDHTVLLARRGLKQRDYVHLVSRDLRERAQRWSIALFSTQPGARPVVSDGRVALRVRDARGQPESHVFDIAEGRFAFRAGAVEPVANDALVADEDANGGRLVVAYGGVIARLFMIDVARGTVRFEHPLPSGRHPIGVALGEGIGFVALPNGHVARIPEDGAPLVDLGAGSVCVVGAAAYMLSDAGVLTELSAARPPAIVTLPFVVAPATRIATCGAASEGRALLALTTTAGAARTSFVTVGAAVVEAGAVVPLRVVAGFGGPRALPTSATYVVPFENGHIGVVDRAGAQRALYRVRNARAPLSSRPFEGGAVIPLGERMVVFVDGTPHVLVVEAEGGSGVFADVARFGRTLFIAVEREVLSLDVRTLALTAHTGTLELLEEDTSRLLLRVDRR